AVAEQHAQRAVAVDRHGIERGVGAPEVARRHGGRAVRGGGDEGGVEDAGHGTVFEILPKESRPPGRPRGNPEGPPGRALPGLEPPLPEVPKHDPLLSSLQREEKKAQRSNAPARAVTRGGPGGPRPRPGRGEGRGAPTGSSPSTRPPGRSTGRPFP